LRFDRGIARKSERKHLKLSVVVCSYNQASYLGQALESLVAQRGLSREELEILVMDGGSTDGSAEIIRQFAPHLAAWVSEPDRGQGHALRKGFHRSTGDILGWLCSDDVLEPEAARITLDYFRSHPDVRCVFGDAYLIDERGRVVRPKKEIPFNRFIWRYDYNYLPQPSTFWRRDLYEQVGGVDESLDVCMDGDLWARFAEVTTLHHIRVVLSRMRLQPQQKTQRLHRESVRVQKDIAARYGVRQDRAVTRQAAFVAAKAMRIGWKLATGCYW
jgi:glycosyltransferase involved in cell wall biosynthesis